MQNFDRETCCEVASWKTKKFMEVNIIMGIREVWYKPGR